MEDVSADSVYLCFRPPTSPGQRCLEGTSIRQWLWLWLRLGLGTLKSTVVVLP